MKSDKLESATGPPVFLKTLPFVSRQAVSISPGAAFGTL